MENPIENLVEVMNEEITHRTADGMSYAELQRIDSIMRINVEVCLFELGDTRKSIRSICYYEVHNEEYYRYLCPSLRNLLKKVGGQLNWSQTYLLSSILTDKAMKHKPSEEELTLINQLNFYLNMFIKEKEHLEVIEVKPIEVKL